MSRADEALNRTFTFNDTEDEDIEPMEVDTYEQVVKQYQNENEFNNDFMKLSITQATDLDNEIFYDPIPKNLSTMTTPRNQTISNTIKSLNSTLTTPIVSTCHLSMNLFDFDEVTLSLASERVSNFFSLNFNIYDLLENECMIELVDDETSLEDTIGPSPESFDLFANDLSTNKTTIKNTPSTITMQASKRFMSEDDLSRLMQVNIDSDKLIQKTSSPLKRKPDTCNTTKAQTPSRLSMPIIKVDLNVTHSISESSSFTTESNLSLDSSLSSDYNTQDKPVFNHTYTSLNVNQMQIEAQIMRQNNLRSILIDNKKHLNTTISKKSPRASNALNSIMNKSSTINTTFYKSPKSQLQLQQQQQQTNNLNSTFELKKKTSPLATSKQASLPTQPVKSLGIPRYSAIPRASNIVRAKLPITQSLQSTDTSNTTTTLTKSSPTAPLKTSPKATLSAANVTKNLPLKEIKQNQPQAQSSQQIQSKLAQPKSINKILIKSSGTSSSIPSLKAPQSMYGIKATAGVSNAKKS